MLTSVNLNFYVIIFITNLLTLCLSPQLESVLPERFGMLIACFNIRMKIILNVKVSCTIGVGTDQDPAERNNTVKNWGAETDARSGDVQNWSKKGLRMDRQAYCILPFSKQR